MNYSRILLAFITLCCCSAGQSSELALPPDEKALVALIKRAFVESDASILVQLTFRQWPDGTQVNLDGIRKYKEKLIGRGLRDITIARIDPPNSDVEDHSVRIRTCLPAELSITIWHTPHSSSTFFAGRADGKLRILVQRVAGTKTPNKSPEPTSCTVMPRASVCSLNLSRRIGFRFPARVTPAQAVAHL